MTNAATLAAVAASGFRRNRIQNGDFRVNQRYDFNGISIAATFNSVFAADRWLVSKGNLSQAITGLGANGQFMYRVDTGGAPAAGEASQIVHVIEGTDMVDLQWGTAGARPVTLSFSAYSQVPGLYCFSISNPGNTRTFVGSFTINVADIYERKVITIPGDTAGTWGASNGDKWQLRFDMGSGTTFTTATLGWNAGNFVRTASAVQFITAANRHFYLREVQLEVGTIATPFEWLPVREQLANCQRWFQKGRVGMWGAASVAGAYAGFTTPHPVPLRVDPIVSLTNISYTNCSALGYEAFFNSISFYVVTGTNAQYICRANYTVDAE